MLHEPQHDRRKDMCIAFFVRLKDDDAANIVDPVAASPRVRVFAVLHIECLLNHYLLFVGALCFHSAFVSADVFPCFNPMALILPKEEVLSSDGILPICSHSQLYNQETPLRQIKDQRECSYPSEA